MKFVKKCQVIDSSTYRSTGVDTTILYPSVITEAISTLNWSSEAAAQALAVAGYWQDLTYFSVELGDVRIALLSSIVSDTIMKEK